MRNFLIAANIIDETLFHVLNKNYEEFKNILSGIEMIEKELQNTLEKNSIKYIDCVGKPFDPNLHQAIGEKESDQEPGTVLEEMQKGYLMHERLLRPSMVFVSKKQAK